MSQSTKSVRPKRRKIAGKLPPLPPKPGKPLTREKLRAWERKLDRLWDVLGIDRDRRDALVAELDYLAAAVKVDPDPLVNILAGLKALLAKHYPQADYAYLFVSHPNHTGHPNLSIPVFRSACAGEGGDQ